MTKLPHRYVVAVDRVSPNEAALTAPPRPALIGGPPEQFHGDPEHWSPEHLLAGSIGLCLFATFEAFAKHDGISLLGYRDVVTAVLDRTSSGPAFSTFTVDVEITVAPADVERARATLDRAAEKCIVSRALVVPVIVTPHIWAHEERHAS